MIYFVRHGETEWNRAGRLQGRADSPLTTRGLEQARAYAAVLARLIEPDRPLQLHASPLGRALRTAEQLAGALPWAGAPRIDALLAEHDVGEWTGLTWAEVERATGITADRLRDWQWRPPGGETRAEMRERAERWLAGRDRGAVHVVVSHGGMSRAFRAAFLELGGPAASELPTHRHGRLYRLDGAVVEEIEIVDGPESGEQLLG